MFFGSCMPILFKTAIHLCSHQLNSTTLYKRQDFQVLANQNITQTPIGSAVADGRLGACILHLTTPITVTMVSIGIQVVIILITIFISSIKTIEPVFPFFGASCFNHYAFNSKKSYALLTSLK